MPEAAERFTAQLTASPRAPVEPADIEALRGFGLAQAADIVCARRSSRRSRDVGPNGRPIVADAARSRSAPGWSRAPALGWICTTD
jgi:hypothetical protein